MKYFFIFCFSLISANGISQSIAGVWKSYDDVTGKLESDVEITIINGKLYGKILKLYNLADPSKIPRCTSCTDYRKNQSQVDMVFITGLKKSGVYWIGDKAMLNPNTGKSYDAKLWLVNSNKLAVRGYLGWFFRTQYWIRMK